MLLSRPLLGLETKTKTLAIRSRDQDLELQVSRPRPGSSLETMVSRSQHWLHQFQLVIKHSLKGATNYGNHATGVGTKHAVLRPRPRPGSSSLETETWTKWTRVSRPWSRDHNTVNTTDISLSYVNMLCIQSVLLFYLFLPVAPMPVLCLSEWTYRHSFFDDLLEASF